MFAGQSRRSWRPKRSGDLYYGGRVYDVRVVAIPAARHSLTSVRNLLVDTPSGEKVRLGEVASVEVKPTPNEIEREHASRKIDVSANVRGRDLGSVIDDLNQALATVEFPLEYHAELLGEYEERQAASQRLTWFAIAAVIGVFVLLQASFGSMRLAIVAFLTLPMALVGGVIAAYMGDGIISLGSLVGFLTVFGIAAETASCSSITISILSARKVCHLVLASSFKVQGNGYRRS